MITDHYLSRIHIKFRRNGLHIILFKCWFCVIDVGVIICFWVLCPFFTLQRIMA